MPEENKISRRSFLKAFQNFLAASGIAVVLGPIVAYFWPAHLEEVPSEPVPIGPEGSIPVGEAQVVRYGRYPAIILNTGDGIRAYSAVCTHFACIVQWDPDLNQIVCPCHEGFFEPLTGGVISGPPPRPLDPIRHFVQDGTLYIGGDA